MSKYSIQVVTLKTDKALTMTYRDKEAALRVWDTTVENALPGQRVELRDPEGRIMSQYTPHKPSWSLRGPEGE